MTTEIGSIVNGKIVSITNFGAFVELENKQIGLVHISEISKKFVQNVSDIYSVNDEVKVKIINMEDNKLSLSIKEALPDDENIVEDDKPFVRQHKKRHPQVFRGLNKKDDPKTFEDMLSRFKQNSEEKISDIKKNIENKRGSYSKKR